MRTIVVSATAIVQLAAGCGDNVAPRCGGSRHLEDHWALEASGIEVEIDRSPYQLRVRNGDGDIVLESSTGAGDGYGPLGWTSGEVVYENFVSPGYFSASAFLDPWRDHFEVVSAEPSSDGLSVTLAGRGSCVEVEHTVTRSTLRVEARAVAEDVRAWSSGFASSEDEGFLGFGERFNRTDQRGLDVFSWAEEGGIGTGEGDAPGPANPFPSGEVMTYYPVPFFLSTAGYGFWLDTTYRSEFKLATEKDDAWRVWHVDPAMAFEVYVPLAGDPRPWPYHIIDLFTAATGRPMLPPAWTFGPRRRISSSYVELGMPEIEAMREQDLAITAVDDSMHFYPSARHIGREASLADWVAQAEDLGYRVNGYFNSFVDRRTDSNMAEWAAEGVASGYFLKEADGQHPDLWIITGSDTPPLYLVDFTNPQATSWYQSSFDWALDLGYSGWMYDFGEYVPTSVVAADGTSGEALHNQYPTLYARAVHDYLESGPQAGDWLAFMRSGYTGSSAFAPMVWSGDPAASFESSDGLPSMVPAALNLGISGAPNSGGDIGGFHCSADGGEAADEELLTRWIQQGSMMPNMQDQNACVGGGSKATIWTAPMAMEAWRTYARLHTRLFPYFFTLAREANRSGTPLMRHLFLEHPDRSDLRDVDDAYYLGAALLVAPVVERGARDKVIRLPDGAFFDWADEVEIAGGEAVTLSAPLEKLPLLLRENQLLPMLDDSIDTLASEEHADVVGPADVGDVYDVVAYLTPGGVAEFELYDGDSLRAELGGAISPPALTAAASPAELKTCDGCYLLSALPGGVQRLRISTSASTVSAGALQLAATSARRIRWDLYVASSATAR